MNEKKINFILSKKSDNKIKVSTTILKKSNIKKVFQSIFLNFKS